MAEPKVALSRHVLSLVPAVLVTLAAALVADTVWTMVRLHSSLPLFDEWYSLIKFRSILSGGQFWPNMFSQHNEHRIFFPRLVLFSDYLFFGGDGVFDKVVIVLTQTVHAAMLILLLFVRPRSVAKVVLASTIVMLLFSLRQEENFNWGFQVQFVGVFALATLASILFAMSVSRAKAERAALPFLVGAYAVAFVATYTMANGVLSAFVLVMLAIVSRSSRWVIVSSAVLAASLMLAYLHGFEPNAYHTPLSFLFQHPLRFVAYASAYLGNFLDPDIGSSMSLGALGLLGAGFAGSRVASGRDPDPLRLALLGILGFTVATAFLTATGRMEYGIDQAMASRYSAGSGVFWSALLIYWWSVSEKMRVGGAMRGFIMLLCVTLVFGATRAQENMKSGAEDRSYSLWQAADALMLGLQDDKSFNEINDTEALIPEYASLLKERRISIFGEADYGLLRQPITKAGRVVGADSCKGDVEAAAAPELGVDGVRVDGHAWELHHRRLAERVYVADEDDRIVGYADREVPRLDSSAWHGFALGVPGVRLRVYARLWGGDLCLLGEVVVISPPS